MGCLQTEPYRMKERVWRVIRVPAELPEARPESLLPPLAPRKAINALGSGRRPGWVNSGLGIDDL